MQRALLSDFVSAGQVVTSEEGMLHHLCTLHKAIAAGLVVRPSKSCAALRHCVPNFAA